ncbi:pantoate--beta-alanine ligase [Candidatus Pelagibacter bacterium]|nr:pantoate--beta-alanine ligase [Candidatus Pelagibacter bacterium]
MKIFKDKHALQKEILKTKGISFVPTMGGLHKGHISLIKQSKKYKFKTLVSIFVNPKQFNKKSDFKSYPRNTKKDVKLLKKLKINYLYIPTFKDIYGFKPKNKVYLDKSSKKLCGKFRKGHFEGVLNVINRFIEIVKPKCIYLGKKDYQQLYLIKKHIEKRKIKSKIIECKTIRETNGIACSSRNVNLSKNQRKIASNIFYYLTNLKKKIKNNYNLFKINKIKKDIINLGADKIDYIENYDIKSFKRIKKSNQKFNLFFAFHIKNTRLIDNI